MRYGVSCVEEDGDGDGESSSTTMEDIGGGAYVIKLDGEGLEDIVGLGRGGGGEMVEDMIELKGEGGIEEDILSLEGDGEMVEDMV